MCKHHGSCKTSSAVLRYFFKLSSFDQDRGAGRPRSLPKSKAATKSDCKRRGMGGCDKV